MPDPMTPARLAALRGRMASVWCDPSKAEVLELADEVERLWAERDDVRYGLAAVVSWAVETAGRVALCRGTSTAGRSGWVALTRGGGYVFAPTPIEAVRKAAGLDGAG